MKNLEASPAVFAVLESIPGMQTAVMRLRRGEASGPLANEHASSAQALLVVRGRVDAQIGEQRFSMEGGDSVIVPCNADHQFVGASNEPALTFNVYAPAAY